MKSLIRDRGVRLAARIMRSAGFQSVAHRIFSSRTIRRMNWDLARIETRLGQRRRGPPASGLLHLGSGGKNVHGWWNVDVRGGDEDVDLACGRLPWDDGVFDAVVSQQTIEHLELDEELRPLLKELYRVLRPGGELWVSCPDIAKVCAAYADGRIGELVEGRRRRFPGFDLAGKPASHMVNELFHQGGEHMNLLDMELASWALTDAGFEQVSRVEEADLLARFPGFPVRGDDDHALYVRALRPTGP